MLFTGSARAADAAAAEPAVASQPAAGADAQPTPSSSTQPPAPVPVPAPGSPIATIGPVTINSDQVVRALLDGYGMNILLNIAQLNMAKEGAARSHITVTPLDVQSERERTIENMFKDSNEKQLDKLRAALDKNRNEEAEKIRQEIRKDNDQAFEHFLTNQHISRAEFDIVTETNAYLRKLAEPHVVGQISEAQLKQSFGALYGERVQCRHIQVSNPQEILEAKRRLASGEPFAKVAQEMSRNPATRDLGGLLQPFSLQSKGLPDNFKRTAFALKEGEISDMVAAEGSYHLILLEKRIQPKAVKYEDVKDSLRKDLEAAAMDGAIKQLRQQMVDQAVQGMQVNDPVLKQQWAAQLAKRQAAIKDKDEIRRQLEKEREQAATQPAVSDLAPAK
jgi:parvulin-like peptidyl-prolyl isomerase